MIHLRFWCQKNCPGVQRQQLKSKDTPGSFTWLSQLKILVVRVILKRKLVTEPKNMVGSR